MESLSKGGLFLAVVAVCVSLSATAGLVMDLEFPQSEVATLSISLVTESGSTSLSVTEQFIKKQTSAFSIPRMSVSSIETVPGDVLQGQAGLVPGMNMHKDANAQLDNQFISGLVSKLLISAEQ